MAKRTFINELGRQITIEVGTGTLEEGGVEKGSFVLYRIVGPDSAVESTLTKMEATVLVEEVRPFTDVRLEHTDIRIQRQKESIERLVARLHQAAEAMQGLLQHGFHHAEAEEPARQWLKEYGGTW